MMAWSGMQHAAVPSLGQKTCHHHSPGLEELALLDHGQCCAVAEHGAGCGQADVRAVACEGIHWHQKLQCETWKE